MALRRQEGLKRGTKVEGRRRIVERNRGRVPSQPQVPGGTSDMLSATPPCGIFNQSSDAASSSVNTEADLPASANDYEAKWLFPRKKNLRLFC